MAPLDIYPLGITDHGIAPRNALPLAPGGKDVEIGFDLAPVEQKYVVNVVDGVDFLLIYDSGGHGMNHLVEAVGTALETHKHALAGHGVGHQHLARLKRNKAARKLLGGDDIRGDKEIFLSSLHRVFLGEIAHCGI